MHVCPEKASKKKKVEKEKTYFSVIIKQQSKDKS